VPRRRYLLDWWEALQATPGRLESSLRVAFATIIVLVAMMALQVPNISFGLYVILLVSNENPAVSLRTGVGALVVVALALSITLGVVIVTDNDPLARIVTLAVTTFLAGMITAVSTVPALGSIFGLVVGVAIRAWEIHAPADTVVKGDLWLLAGFATGISGAVAVSYLFSARSPADRLASQLRLRYRALAAMFEAYGGNGEAKDEPLAAAQVVSRLAGEGPQGMLELHRQIIDRNLPSGSLPSAVQCHIIAIAELLANAAAFGLQPEDLDKDRQSRCRAIAEQCEYLARELGTQPELHSDWTDSAANTHLERVENVLDSLRSAAGESCKLETLVSRHVPLLVPGAASNIANVAFALKISLCATICYIVYHALDWPGISTSVTTVMVAGLATTGAMKQKLTFRLVGATVGGLVLGLGAEVFLFPFMDSITSLMVVVGAVAFLSAWIGAGPRFQYVGIQIAYAFYLVSLSGFATPTELSPARDRLAGIILAVAVMWLVFDQLWPVRTTTEMRRVVASVLRDASRVFGLSDNRLAAAAYARESGILRDRLAQGLSKVRTLNDAAQYEFGPDREFHVLAAGKLMQMSLTTVALVWNHAATLDQREGGDSMSDAPLVALRQTVKEGLSSIADEVQKKRRGETEPLAANEASSEYVRLTISRFNELRILSAAFDS